MKRTTIFLDPASLAAIKRIQKRTKEFAPTMSAVIRAAVQRWDTVASSGIQLRKGDRP